eukprot:gene11532-3432_t
MAAKEKKEVKIATDGSYLPKSHKGAVGVAIQIGESKEVTRVGANIGQLISSSTQAEMIAALFLGAATRLAGPIPSVITTLVTDNLALQKLPERSPSGPLEETLSKHLCDLLPPYTWAKGHSEKTEEERLVQHADRIAANTKTKATIRVEDLYAVLDPELVFWECQNEDHELFTQTEEIGKYVKTVRRLTVEPKVRKRVLDPERGVPEAFIQRPILKKWKSWHGAVDLIQAIARRIIAPHGKETKDASYICMVPGCTEKPNLTHIIEKDDANHRIFMGPLESLIFPQPTRYNKKMDLLNAIARGELPALIQLCASLKVFTEENNPANKWSTDVTKGNHVLALVQCHRTPQEASRRKVATKGGNRGVAIRNGKMNEITRSGKAVLLSCSICSGLHEKNTIHHRTVQKHEVMGYEHGKPTWEAYPFCATRSTE